MIGVTMDDAPYSVYLVYAYGMRVVMAAFASEHDARCYAGRVRGMMQPIAVRAPSTYPLDDPHRSFPHPPVDAL